ncbi:hypothetical protein ACOSP7_021826 [Xanthoceras sorbifolium]
MPPVNRMQPDYFRPNEASPSGVIKTGLEVKTKYASELGAETTGHKLDNREARYLGAASRKAEAHAKF